MGDCGAQKDKDLENVSIHKGAKDHRNCDGKKKESVKDDSLPMTKAIDEDKSNATKETGNLSARDNPCNVYHMSSPRKSLRACELQEQKRLVDLLESLQGTAH